MEKSYGSKAKLTLLSTLAVVALLSLTGVAYADPSPQMVGSQWAVYEQTTLPNGSLLFYVAAHATTISTGGVEFQMPDATSSSPTYVNYLLNTYATSLVEGNTIAATINVVTSSSATTFVGNPDGGCPAGTCPGAVRLFFQSSLAVTNAARSNCIGGFGTNENNYWWSNPTSYSFVAGGSGGTITLSVPLNPADWSNICGQFGSSNIPVFNSALANIKYIGLSFGSGYYFANGLGVDGSTGTATFQLVTYTIS